MFLFVWKTLHHIKCNTKCVWRAQLVEGPKFICRWCYLRHRKLTGVWVEKLLLASRGYDIWFGPNRSILPTDQMPHRSWCWFVPTRPAAHIRASFLSLGLQDVCDGTIWQNAVCHVGVLALPTCYRPDASQLSPLPFSWDWAARVAMEICGCCVGMKRKGGGSQAIESNKSDRSQQSWQWIWLLMCSSYQRAAVLERWSVTYWSALTASKWCCKKQT